MDDTTPDLAQTVEQLTAEVARLRALVEAPGGPIPAAEPSAGSGVSSADQPIDRRSALRRAGLMAAGAVTGGAAIVAATASPAAAATVTGSGSPGVSGTGVGGDGVVGTTSQRFSSGVYGYTSTATAYGVFARSQNGEAIALAAEGDSNSGTVAQIATSGTQLAIRASSRGGVLQMQGSALADTDSVTLYHGGESGGQQNSAVTVNTYGHGLTTGGIGATQTGQKTGVRIDSTDIGVSISGCRVAMQFSKNPVLPPPPQRVLAAVAGTVDYDGSALWLCVASGTPGTWRRMAGTATAGAFEVLPAPARIYDSRPGSQPQEGPKTKLVPNQARTLDCKANSSGVPAGATAVMLTVLLVNAANGSGNCTVWANGVAKPQANTAVWGGDAGRFTATAVSALDAQARIQVAASASTDIVIDVVGFYR